MPQIYNFIMNKERGNYRNTLACDFFFSNKDYIDSEYGILKQIVIV